THPTTLRCTLTRCIMATAQRNAACAGPTFPANVTAKLTQAENLIDQAETSPAEKARKLLKRAKKTLKRAEAKAIRATKDKTAKLSSDCAAALKGAADGVVAGLGV